MSKQRLNIELFKKIRDRIATIPESYHQGTWCDDSHKAPCGTVACLAGEAIICAAPTVEEGVKELRRLYEQEPDPYAIARRAARLLNLDANCRSSLDREAAIFLDGAAGWPYRFAEMFDANEARGAVAFLDWIIETGKVLE